MVHTFQTKNLNVYPVVADDESYSKSALALATPSICIRIFAQPEILEQQTNLWLRPEHTIGGLFKHSVVL